MLQPAPKGEKNTKDIFAIERSIILAFIVPQRRRRYFALLDACGGREKLTSSFAHSKDFDKRFLVSIPPKLQRPESIADMLRQRGAKKTCYVWSNSATLDGREIDIEEALAAVVGYEPGTVLSCISGHLGYYEGEELNQRYILARLDHHINPKET